MGTQETCSEWCIIAILLSLFYWAPVMFRHCLKSWHQRTKQVYVSCPNATVVTSVTLCAATEEWGSQATVEGIAVVKLWDPGTPRGSLWNRQNMPSLHCSSSNWGVLWQERYKCQGTWFRCSRGKMVEIRTFCPAGVELKDGSGYIGGRECKCNVNGSKVCGKYYNNLKL